MKFARIIIGLTVIAVLLALLWFLITPPHRMECKIDEDCIPEEPLMGVTYYCDEGICKTKPFGNPASMYCEEQGGTIEIRTKPDGGQYGVCVFSDGSECEEWTYYRGECQPGTNYTTTTITEHHGSSTHGNCSTNDDCIISGCNSEICQSKFEEPLVSICVYNPPYPKDLGYECRCVDNKCMWAA